MEDPQALIVTIQVITSIISSIMLGIALLFSIFIYKRLKGVSSIGLLLLATIFMIFLFNVLEAFEHGLSAGLLEQVQDLVLVAAGSFSFATAVGFYWQLPRLPYLIRATHPKDHRHLMQWLKRI